MQMGSFMDLIAWALIIIGSIIILFGIFSMLTRVSNKNLEERKESKGIILLGPIPIVWGFGRKVWIVAAILAITLFLIAILWWP